MNYLYKVTNKKIECHLLQSLLGAWKVNYTSSFQEEVGLTYTTLWANSEWWQIKKFSYFFSRKQDLTFHAKCLLHAISKPVLRENKKNISICLLLKILPRVFKILPWFFITRITAAEIIAQWEFNLSVCACIWVQSINYALLHNWFAFLPNIFDIYPKYLDWEARPNNLDTEEMPQNTAYSQGLYISAATCPVAFRHQQVLMRMCGRAGWSGPSLPEDCVKHMPQKNFSLDISFFCKHFTSCWCVLKLLDQWQTM